MLIRFALRNFLNFSNDANGGDIEYSSLAGRVRQKRETHVVETAGLDVLRFCALYGANGAGKSNLVKALAFFQTVITRGDFPAETSNLCCKLSETHKQRPSRFEIEFEIDGVVYAYGFEALLAKRQVLSEWLYRLNKKGNDTTIFERLPEEGSFEVTASPETRLGNYLEDFSVNCKKLFLSHINQAGLKFTVDDAEGKVLKCVYKWLTSSLRIVSSAFATQSITYFDKGEIGEEALYLALKSFGTGIEGIQYEDVPFERFLEDVDTDLRDGIIRRIETLRAREEKCPSFLFGLLSRKRGNAIYRFKVSGVCQGSLPLNSKNNCSVVSN